MDDRFVSHQAAIGKAEDAMDRRLQGMNGFQSQLREQSAKMATREAVESTVKALTALIDRNREDLAEQRGVHVTVTTFDGVVSELSSWRSKVDLRDAERQNIMISRPALDDLLKPMNDNVSALQRWQFKIVGAVGILGVIMPLVTGLLVYFLTRTAVPIDGLAK
ncbi:MAG: hypothetical protein H0U53_10910 [Actinobacteria bacterium]|nr:hypothetical protein [Actinomycetota bacterium]